MKRLLPVAAAATTAALLLTGCGSAGEQSGDGKETKKVTVGISQFVEHPSLDAARDGFVEALKDGGYTEGENLTLDVQNASGDQATATNIASNFASSGDDLILGIATPSAQSLAQAVTDKPVLFTAVTDPVDAGLVDSAEAPGGNVTGTTDMNPVADQIKLVKQLKPSAKSVGIIYSSGETRRSRWTRPRRPPRPRVSRSWRRPSPPRLRWPRPRSPSTPMPSTSPPTTRSWPGWRP